MPKKSSPLSESTAAELQSLGTQVSEQRKALGVSATVAAEAAAGEGPMFNRPHHQRIAHVLSALDGSVLAQNACWFAGGTCIALKFGEYRESVRRFFAVRPNRTKG